MIRRIRKLDYGRLDYQVRSKRWRAVGYGLRVETIGTYATRDAAAAALQKYVTTHHGKSGYGRPI